LVRTATRLLVSLAAVAASLVAVPAAAGASGTTQDPCYSPTSVDPAARAKAIDLAITKMHQRGLPQSQVNRELAARYRVQAMTSSAGPNDPQPRSDGDNDVTVYSPVFYYDQCTEHWTVAASFSWNGLDSVEDDTSRWCMEFLCAVGGEDGFGVALSRNVPSTYGFTMYTYGIDAGSFFQITTGNSHPADANVYGVTFMGQDRYKFCYLKKDDPRACVPNTRDYSWYHGDLYYDVSDIGCGVIQAFAKYGHGWTDTAVNGFGVGPYSLSIQWYSAEDRWAVASQPSRPLMPC